jgi:hypothetical protein
MNIVNTNKIFLLVLLLVLFVISTNKLLLIPVTLIVSGFFIVKKQYNIAIIVLSALFGISLIYNNNLEFFGSGGTVTKAATTNAATKAVTNTATKATKATKASTTTGTATNASATNASATNASATAATKAVTKAADHHHEHEHEHESESEPESEPSMAVTTISTPDYSIHTIGVTDYSKLLFVLNSLLDNKYFNKNRKNIEKVIDTYKINSIFDLSKKVLNAKKNPIYNNFLEKITCIDNNGKTNFIKCDNKNYKKLYAFCELLLVFTLDLDKILELINTNEIMSVCQLSANRVVLEDFDNQTSFGYELLGLEYYLNEKSFSRKYFDILKMLDLDTFLSTKSEEVHLSLREKLYNYHNTNRSVVKDLNSIMVLFDYYNIFDSYVLNLEDDDYNWNLGILKSVNLMHPCWDNVIFFKEYDVKERIIKAINKLTSVDDEFLNRAENPINPYANETEIKDPTQEVYQEEDDIFKNNLDTFRKRYKTVYDKKTHENKEVYKKVNTKLSLTYIKHNFPAKMIDIINEIVQLSKRKCDLECDNSTNPMFSKFIFYVGEVFKIITKEERMLFVGGLMVVISVLLNFIIASK